MKHFDFVVFWLNFWLKSWIIFLQLQEFFRFHSTWSTLFGKSLDFSTQNDNFKSEFIRKLPFLFKLLLHCFTVSLIQLNVSNQTHDMILWLNKNYIKLFASGFKVLDFSGFGFIIGQGSSESFVFVIFSFQHVWESIFLLDVFEQFSIKSLWFSVSFFRPSLPVIKFFFDGINLFLILSDVGLWLLNLLFVWLVMIDFGM